MPHVHELKCDPIPFQDVWDGRKTCEVRNNDRDYKVGDHLLLRERRMTAQQAGILRVEAGYTGREQLAEIIHIQTGYGLPDEIVVLSFACPAASLDEWHEDQGCCMWFAWDEKTGDWLHEPAWIGTPHDSDWPGYHTHWTTHPNLPPKLHTAEVTTNNSIA